jgi:hypothetical protein
MASDYVMLESTGKHSETLETLICVATRAL